MHPLDQIKNWIKLCEQDINSFPTGDEQVPQVEEPTEQEIADMTPSEILDKVREIVNTKIDKSGDEESQITQLLTDSAKYLKNYIPQDEQGSEQNIKQQSAGAAVQPNDTNLAQGADLQQPPPSGGQL